MRTWACHVGSNDCFEQISPAVWLLVCVEVQVSFAAKYSLYPTSSTLDARNRHAGVICTCQNSSVVGMPAAAVCTAGISRCMA
jgi:hypothetical protein